MTKKKTTFLPAGQFEKPPAWRRRKPLLSGDIDGMRMYPGDIQDISSFAEKYAKTEYAEDWIKVVESVKTLKPKITTADCRANADKLLKWVGERRNWWPSYRRRNGVMYHAHAWIKAETTLKFIAAKIDLCQAKYWPPTPMKGNYWRKIYHPFSSSNVIWVDCDGNEVGDPQRKWSELVKTGGEIQPGDEYIPTGRKWGEGRIPCPDPKEVVLENDEDWIQDGYSGRVFQTPKLKDNWQAVNSVIGENNPQIAFGKTRQEAIDRLVILLKSKDSKPAGKSKKKGLIAGGVVAAVIATGVVLNGGSVKDSHGLEVRSESNVAYNRAEYGDHRSKLCQTEGLGFYTKQPLKRCQVDHVVSLKEAHESGAHAWSDAKKREFSQYAGNHVASEGCVNASKGSRDAGEWTVAWISKSKACGGGYVVIDWCEHIKVVIKVKLHWGLSVDKKESDKINEC